MVISRTITIAGILLAIGLFLLLWFLYRVLRRTSYYARGHNIKRPPRKVGIAGILMALIALIVSWSLFWAADNLRFFRKFSANRICFRLDIWQIDDPVKSMKFVISYPGQDTNQAPPAFYLSGDKWRIEGKAVEIKGPARYLFDGERCFAITDVVADRSQSWLSRPDDFIFDRNRLPGAESKLGEAVGRIGWLGSLFDVRGFQTSFQEVLARQSFVGRIGEDGQLMLEAIAAESTGYSSQ